MDWGVSILEQPVVKVRKRLPSSVQTAKTGAGSHSALKC